MGGGGFLIIRYPLRVEGGLPISLQFSLTLLIHKNLNYRRTNIKGTNNQLYLTSRGKFEHLKRPSGCDSIIVGSEATITISCLDFARHLLYLHNCAWLPVTMVQIIISQ